MEGKYFDALLFGICGLALSGWSAVWMGSTIENVILDDLKYLLSPAGQALLLFGIVPLGKNGRQKGTLICVVVGATLLFLGMFTLGLLLMFVGLVVGSTEKKEK